MPIGHALGGVAAGCLVAASLPIARRDPTRPPAGRAPGLDVRTLALFALLGMLADLDFLIGMHRSVTHSVGATAVAGGIAAALASRDRVRWAVRVAVAYGSHVLLDWVGTDPGPPLGVMALWPWTSEYYLSDLHLFMRVCREYWLPSCWWNNLLGLCREVLVLAPLAAGAVVVAGRRGVRRAE